MYEWLADELRQGITSGQYRRGPLPFTLELMEKTGVANLPVRARTGCWSRRAWSSPFPSGVPRLAAQRHGLAVDVGTGGRKVGAELLDTWLADAAAFMRLPGGLVWVGAEVAFEVAGVLGFGRHSSTCRGGRSCCTRW